jgi:hypothetical protein
MPELRRGIPVKVAMETAVRGADARWQLREAAQYDRGYLDCS